MTVMGSRANGIEKATGVAWSDWTAWLTAQRAQEREHGTIARLAEQRLRELGISRHATTGEQLNTGWWAQAIAVDFEHDHGMRRPGQTARAGFAVTVTRRCPGPSTTRSRPGWPLQATWTPSQGGACPASRR